MKGKVIKLTDVDPSEISNGLIPAETELGNHYKVILSEFATSQGLSNVLQVLAELNAKIESLNTHSDIPEIKYIQAFIPSGGNPCPTLEIGFPSFGTWVDSDDTNGWNNFPMDPSNPSNKFPVKKVSSTLYYSFNPKVTGFQSSWFQLNLTPSGTASLIVTDSSVFDTPLQFTSGGQIVINWEIGDQNTGDLQSSVGVTITALNSSGGGVGTLSRNISNSDLGNRFSDVIQIGNSVNVSALKFDFATTSTQWNEWGFTLLGVTISQFV